MDDRDADGTVRPAVSDASRAGALVSAKLAVELWKTLRALDRVLPLLPAEHQGRIQAQLRFSRGRLDSLVGEAGLRLASFDNQAYGPSVPATAVNVDEFGDADDLIVTQTVEPTIIGDGQILLMGRVMVGKQDTNKG